MAVGFLGLGRMGEPMALNLVRAGTPLLVWNRSDPARVRLRNAGASVASSSRMVLRQSATVILMLANHRVIDLVLERGSPDFAANVGGRTIVNMGTTSPQYSKALEEEISGEGGSYVEAPVSGSRKPAEDAELVAMLAGDAQAVECVRLLIRPLCRDAFVCGEVPKALLTKLAVNLFLITMVTGLVEATHFAANHGLDMELFRAVLDAGPMASSVSRVKLDKLVRTDFSPQASVSDVLMNNRLVAEAARTAQLSSPLLDQCHQLFAETEAMGLGKLDMVGVLAALEELTSTRRMAPPSPDAIGSVGPSA